MERRLLAIFAHPDDESFGPSGTLSHYVRSGARVRLLTATKGEAGKNATGNTDEPLGKLREKELLQAANVIGLEEVAFMGYIDKTLQDLEPHRPVEKIVHYIADFKPQVIITYGPTGISRHSDHITVHHWTTRAFKMAADPLKLYYYTLTKELMMQRYPDLTDGEGDVTTTIDVREYVELKKEAVLCHQTQRYSIERLFNFAGGSRPIATEEHFILADTKLNNYSPTEIEADLFAGIFQSERSWK